jgi:hypothetical protein
MALPPDVEIVLSRVAKFGMSSVLDLEQNIAFYNRAYEFAPPDSVNTVVWLTFKTDWSKLNAKIAQEL